MTSLSGAEVERSAVPESAPASSPAATAPVKRVDQLRMACRRSSGGRLMRSLALMAVLHSWVVEADDVDQRWRPGNCVCRQPTRDDCGLDAAGIQAAVRPIAGDRQVVVGAIER